MVTNGTRLLGRAEELVRSGLLAVGISVDPPGPNDLHRGDGTFAICKTVIGQISVAKEALGSKTPLVEIYTTVYEGTYSLLAGWADQLADWRIDTLRLQHQIWLRTKQRPVSEQLIHDAIGDSTFFRSDVDTYCSDLMPNVDVVVLEEQLRQLETRAYPFRLEFHPPLPVKEMMEFYRNPEFRRVTARPCTLISNYAFVDPAGLYPASPWTWETLRAPVRGSVERPEISRLRRLLRREERLPLCERCRPEVRLLSDQGSGVAARATTQHA